MDDNSTKYDKIARYAPTPSGLLHLGNVLNFIFTWSLAKKNNAQILLRIDDLDGNRVRDEYIADIFNTLDWLDLDYQIGPSSVDEFKKYFSQSNRIELYKEYMRKIENIYNYSCVIH